MLVLSRRESQKIHIGDNITVTILKTQGKSVRIGIEAPQNVRVVRGELPPREPPSNAAAPLNRGGQGAVATQCSEPLATPR